MPFLGLIIVGLGAVLYALAISNVFHTASNPNWDPFGTEDNFGSDISLLIASYAVMMFGGVVFLVSLIVLVIKSD